MFINYDTILLVIFSYLIGSIPFGLLISLLMKKKDPRYSGSNNIGATNIARTSGWRLGMITLILDVLKAYIPISFIIFNFYENLNLVIVFIILGHLFPIWLKFKGGKGVAVFIGVLLAYNPIYGLIYLISWLAFALIFKYSSLSALLATVINLIVVFYFEENYYIFFFASSLIFLKHIPNIERLIAGKETKINLKKKK